MMKKMMKKLVAVMMMSLTLAVPPARSAEAAGHDNHPGGQPRQEQRMDQRGGGKQEQRLGQPGGHRERMDPHEPMHGKHHPARPVPRHHVEPRGGRHGSDGAAAMVGGLLLGVILGAAIESANN